MGDVYRGVKEIESELEQVKRCREILEKRYDARLATLEEFEMIRMQSLVRLKQNLRSRGAALGERARAVVRDISLVQNRLNKCLASTGPQESTQESLARAKDRYKQHIEKRYPEWQKRVEEDHIQRLKSLDDTKAQLMRRRELAEEAFQREQSLRALIAEKEHTVGLLRNQEREEMKLRDRERLAMESNARNMAKMKITENEKPGMQFDVQRIDSPVLNEDIELSYEWQAVPYSMELDSKVDTKLEFDDALGDIKLARIPYNWTLHVQVNIVPPQNLEIRVTKDLEIKQVLEQLCGHPDINRNLSEKSVTLKCGDRELSPDSTIEDLGYQFFSLPVSLKVHEPLHPVDGEICHNAEELSYEWAAYDKKTVLPLQTEFGAQGNINRLARIPSTWLLTVNIQSDDSRNVEIQVNKSFTIQDIVNHTIDLGIIKKDGASVYCDGMVVAGSATVEELGLDFFTKPVILREKRPISPKVRLDSPPLSISHSPHSGVSPISMSPKRQDWKVAQAALNFIINSLQDEGMIAELQRSKYGTLGDAGSSNAIDTAVRDVLENHAPNSSGGATILCKAILEILKTHCAGLIPISAFESTGRIAMLIRDQNLSKDAVNGVIMSYHNIAEDGRKEVWESLLLHWSWIVEHEILSPDQVANTFVKSLLPPEDHTSDTLESNVKLGMIELLTKPEAYDSKAEGKVPGDRLRRMISKIDSDEELGSPEHNESLFRRNSVQDFVAANRNAANVAHDLEASDFIDDDDFDF